MKHTKYVVSFDDKKVLKPELSEDAETPMFLKLVEEARRERKRQLDSGNETAALKFQTQDGHGDRRQKGKGKGKFKDFGKDGMKGGAGGMGFGQAQQPGMVNGPMMG